MTSTILTGDRRDGAIVHFLPLFLVTNVANFNYRRLCRIYARVFNLYTVRATINDKCEADYQALKFLFGVIGKL